MERRIVARVVRQTLRHLLSHGSLLKKLCGRSRPHFDLRAYFFFFFPNKPPSASTGEVESPVEFLPPVNPPKAPPRPPFSWLPTMPCTSGMNLGSEVVP